MLVDVGRRSLVDHATFRDDQDAVGEPITSGMSLEMTTTAAPCAANALISP